MNYCTYYGQYIDPQLEVRICLQCLSVQGRLDCPHKINKQNQSKNETKYESTR